MRIQLWDVPRFDGVVRYALSQRQFVFFFWKPCAAPANMASALFFSSYHNPIDWIGKDKMNNTQSLSPFWGVCSCQKANNYRINNSVLTFAVCNSPIALPLLVTSKLSINSNTTPYLTLTTCKIKQLTNDFPLFRLIIQIIEKRPVLKNSIC